MEGAIPEGLFTKEQIEFVDKVPDSDLRMMLLHTVRLRDNMEKDRDAFEKMSVVTLEKAIKVLCSNLSEDKSAGSYYYSWQSNIAMAFFDQFINDHENILAQRILSEVSNKAAKRFLETLIKTSSVK